MKKNKQSGFGDYTQTELRHLEANLYNLCMGGDFVPVDGSYFFTKKEVYQKYNEIFDELLGFVEDNANDNEREYALDLMATMHVQVVRLH